MYKINITTTKNIERSFNYNDLDVAKTVLTSMVNSINVASGYIKNIKTEKKHFI